MAGGARLRSEAARRDRAERVLDAAGELLLRLGYRRATVDDVADRAGVGKGTVYLHWKTREALFLAVLQREVVASMDQLVAALKADAAVGVLHRLTEVHFLNVMRRPLLRALYTSDPGVLGKLATALHAKQGERHHDAFDDYLRLLADNGLLRDDLPIREISYAYHAILHGYLGADGSSPEARGASRGDRGMSPGGRDLSLEDRGAPPEDTDLSLEDKARLLADTVRRTFEPSAEPSGTAVQDVGPRVVELFAEAAELGRAQIHTS
ncbi:TetR/AcrR family transcriptional regulator [Nocardia mexicana]|uniref:TetR family transcriptional regulator n=1 Tax=Nocardia mexicana TaxID=279262 RepID=A0A370H3A5_9NOCA|nr:TetR/AcrR family transcriptional regulator [Nocardia mexicana]RDI49642.1 TetR family transcriptional regulator [Nocardia mexicana]